MKQIDQQYMTTPFYGVIRMTHWLRNQGFLVNVKRVRKLMRLMGLVAIYPKPRLSLGGPSHRKYPYLLKNIPIVYLNQVWSTDITYVPLQQGYLYLV